MNRDLDLLGRRASWSLPIFVLLGLLLLSLLAAGAEEKLRARQEQLAQAEHDATSLALLVDQHVGRVFEEIDNALERIADKTEGRSWDQIEHTRPLWQFTRKLIQDVPLLHSLELYDQEGRLRLSSGRFPTPRQGMIRLDTERIRERIASSVDPLFVAGPAKGQNSERWYMSVGRAVPADAGAVRGFVIGSVEPLALRDFFRWAPIGEHGAIELIYSDGTIVVSTNSDERLVGRRSAAAALLSRLDPAHRDVALGGDALGDGVARVVALHAMTRLPFTVVVELTRADVLRNWLQRFLWDAGIGIAVMIAFVVLAVLLHRRMTGEHRATIAARIAEQRLHDAVESIGEGVALWDVRDRLVICNSRYRELHALPGLSIEAALAFEELVKRHAAAGRGRGPGERDAWIAQRLERHRALASSFEHEQGNGRWLMISERRTSDGGIVELQTDITPLKEKEQELERLVLELDEARNRTEAQAAELAQLAERYAEAHRQAAEANTSKTMFLASMSHELRTPLNAILGFSELMMRETFGPLGSEKYKEYAADVHRSGELLLELINDVLDLSKIEAGKLDLIVERQNLIELVDESVRLVRARARAKGVKLLVGLPSDLPHVRADRRAAKQILLNLLSNAIKFTGKGGSVSVSAEANGDKVTVAVRDTGIGIAPPDIERLFQPFARASNAASLEGTGLGLAIARTLAVHSGGALRLDSRVGEGTVVWLELPVDGENRPIADAA